MRFSVLVILLLMSCSSPAAAEEIRLNFGAVPDDIRAKQIIDLLYGNGLQKELPFVAAPYDLNNDGVNEWIIRQDNASNCKAQASCKFYIGATSERKPVLLAKIEAGSVNIQSDRLYGINKLSVYNDPNDDFSAQTFVWKPKISSFLPL